MRRFRVKEGRRAHVHVGVCVKEVGGLKTDTPSYARGGGQAGLKSAAACTEDSSELRLYSK